MTEENDAITPEETTIHVQSLGLRIPLGANERNVDPRRAYVALRFNESQDNNTRRPLAWSASIGAHSTCWGSSARRVAIQLADDLDAIARGLREAATRLPDSPGPPVANLSDESS